MFFSEVAENQVCSTPNPGPGHFYVRLVKEFHFYLVMEKRDLLLFLLFQKSLLFISQKGRKKYLRASILELGEM